MKLVEEWDKTFPKSNKVNHKKVTFHNRFGIELVGDLYEPKEYDGKLAAIAVCGPFGAVKEQASGLYAQKLAEMGYLTMAFDPSFTGESGGTPRYVASPDINTDDFSAAVDFFSTQDNVDFEKIGIVGICGWGGIAINATQLDSRIKATVTSTMYNMCRVTENGYFDSEDSPEYRQQKRINLNQQRTIDYKNGTYQRDGGVLDPLPDDAPQFVKDYHDYYKTERGYHPRSLNSNDGWNITSNLSFLNNKLYIFADEIETPIMLIHGENAHSYYFSKDTYKQLKGDNKDLIIIPSAVHVDLYDNLDVIPFDTIKKFFDEYL